MMCSSCCDLNSFCVSYGFKLVCENLYLCSQEKYRIVGGVCKLLLRFSRCCTNISWLLLIRARGTTSCYVLWGYQAFLDAV